jgi:hypothetical protein
VLEFELIEDPPGDDGPGSLFHSRSFFNLHAGAHGRFFAWVRKSRVMARVHFTPVQPELWRSPALGTFAGYAASDDLRLEDLFAFHDAVAQRLAAGGARRIEVLPAPMAHAPEAFAAQVYLLRSRGFEITRCDLNQSLEIGNSPLANHMDYGQVKRLRKCLREGLVARRLSHSALPQVVETLALNRAHRGRAMSMTLAQLQAMADTFPDAVQLFGCHDGEQLAAAALCLRLSERVLYVAFWGDLPDYATLSPVVAVADAIYIYCQSEGIALLDAGTSTEDGEPNFGLLRFKHGLGFNDSLKLRLSASL